MNCLVLFLGSLLVPSDFYKDLDPQMPWYDLVSDSCLCARLDIWRLRLFKVRLALID